MIENKHVKIIEIGSAYLSDEERKRLNIGINDKWKIAKYDDYNYIMNMNTGYFLRWGKTKEDDPQVAPAPEILDIEVTTICQKGCKFCYKANTSNGINMSLDTFKRILDIYPTNITQLAFGADSGAVSNPDLFDMAKYARDNDVIPNITVADITKDTAKKLAEVMGAVAVSRYENKDECYNSVKLLTDEGMTQINIHIMASLETFHWIKETIYDIKHDERLEKLNALIFLSLKKKGRGINHTSLTDEQFKELVELSEKEGISIGFDSCSAPKYLRAIKDNPNKDKLEQYVEPCESACFSSYISAEGKFYPCSFLEEHPDWKDGIDVLQYKDIRDMWNSERIQKVRDKLKESNRECPFFEV